jgi:glycosyltransferase involved in cell wall biosynthesis
MRLSVITATYNLIEAGRAEMFRAMAARVAAQTQGEVEHLIIDGGSNDGTQALGAEVCGAGLARFLSEPDRGVYDAMNKGAAQATGDYILFLNSDDDLLSDDALAGVVKGLNAELDFLAAPVIFETDDGTQSTSGVSRFFARVLTTMPFCHQGLVMRRDLFESLGGFDLRFPVAADYDLVLRMFLGGAKGRVLSEPFSLFRPGGISSDRAALARDHRAIWCARLPGANRVDAAEWDTAERRKTLPQPVLRALLNRGDLPLRIRLIARWHLLRKR